MYTSVHSNLRDQNDEMTSSWDIVFICDFNDRELESEDWFFDILYSSLTNSEELDSMSWNLMSNQQFGLSLEKAFSSIWCVKAPKRVSIFMWTVAWERYQLVTIS